MTAKFRVGDRVRILSTLTSRDLRKIGIDGNIDEYVGNVDLIDNKHRESYHLENCGWWFPEDMLEKADEEEDFDRYVITLERFDMDGKKYMSGSADICGPEFYGMWDCYIA